MGVDIGSRIRLKRKELGLSQAKLAEKLEISTNSVNRFECGHRTPDSKIITQMGEILCCDVSWLLSGGVKQPNTGSGLPVYRAWDNVQDDGVDFLGFLSYPDIRSGDFCFQVTDLQMFPMIGSGDIAIVQQDQLLNNKLVCVADDFGSIHIGWLRLKEGTRYLVPENSNYSAILFENTRALGTVVGIVKYQNIY